MESKKVYFCYKCNELYYSSNAAALRCPNCKEPLTSLDVTSDKWEFMTEDEHNDLLRSKIPSVSNESVTGKTPAEKATSVRICRSCEKAFVDRETECPLCKGQLINTKYSSIYWSKCDNNERKKHIAEYVEKPKANTDEVPVVKAQEKTSSKSSSSCASWIQGLSGIIGVLCVFGSFFIMSEVGFPIGFAVLFISVLTCSLAFGIGEIIELLFQINSKLK